jgi:hypothetical protein
MSQIISEEGTEDAQMYENFVACPDIDTFFGRFFVF